jgi:hypothetical protein
MLASTALRNMRAPMSTTILTHPRVSVQRVLYRGGGWIRVLALWGRSAFLRCSAGSDALTDIRSGTDHQIQFKRRALNLCKDEPSVQGIDHLR